MAGELLGKTGGERETETVTSFRETYKKIALTCFRYLDFKSFDEVDRLTLPEYNLLMEAVRLKQIDLDYRNHLQAYLNFAVQATKKSGKSSRPVYRTFKQFFDYEKAIQKAKNTKSDKKSKFSGVGSLLKKRGC